MDTLTKLNQINDKMAERQKMEEEFEQSAKIQIQKNKILQITSFTDYFEFLDNKFLTPVYYEGTLYPSVTHAFHAARSTDENTKKAILNADSFKTVGNIARRINDPEKWELRRLKVMEMLVRDKFRRSKELQEKLKATTGRELIMTYNEESSGNLFWGVVNGKGQNQLGRILSKIREDLMPSSNTSGNTLNFKEIYNWISNCFDLVTEYNLLPEIQLTVIKDTQTIDHIVLKGQAVYKFGNLPDSDVVLAHPSISRLHAVIICDKNLGVVLVDLRSKAGTKLGEEVLRDHIPYKISSGNKIKFALSSRDYIITIDTTKIKRVYEKEKLKLEDELQMLQELEKGNTSNKKKQEIVKKSLGITNDADNDNIFIKNIPLDADVEEIRKLFEENFGEVRNFKCPIDRTTGTLKGFAFIQFKSKEKAKEAVDYGLIGYKGDWFLKIKYAEPKPYWGRDDQYTATKNSISKRHEDEDIRKKISENLNAKEKEYREKLKYNENKHEKKEIERKKDSSYKERRRSIGKERQIEKNRKSPRREEKNYKQKSSHVKKNEVSESESESSSEEESGSSESESGSSSGSNSSESQNDSDSESSSFGSSSSTEKVTGRKRHRDNV
jgi:ribA/ribD-fused uncharacterized protein